MDSNWQTITLYQQAPEKPLLGEKCNGCGVCCSCEPCPLGARHFKITEGACPALTYAEGRYHCGILIAPQQYWPWIPSWMISLTRRWIKRKIAAGSGCDSDAIFETK